VHASPDCGRSLATSRAGLLWYSKRQHVQIISTEHLPYPRQRLLLPGQSTTRLLKTLSHRPFLPHSSHINMFNRGISNPFGGGGTPSPGRGQQLPNAQREPDGRFRQGGGPPPPQYGEKPRSSHSGSLSLSPTKSPDNSYTFGNL